MLYGSQNRLSKPLHACYMLFGIQNRLSKRTQPPTPFLVVKIYSPNIYRSPTYFGAVKPTLRPSTGLLHLLQQSTPLSLNVLWLPTRFAVVETNSANLLRSPTRYVTVKTDSEPPQVPNALSDSQNRLRTFAGTQHAL